MTVKCGHACNCFGKVSGFGKVFSLALKVMMSTLLYQ